MGYQICRKGRRMYIVWQILTTRCSTSISRKTVSSKSLTTLLLLLFRKHFIAEKVLEHTETENFRKCNIKIYKHCIVNFG
jgi:hypothetical protein